MSKKVILTDCDGVLLDWYNHFSKWMDKRGYKSRPIESYEVYGQVLLKRYDLTLDEHDALCQEFNHSAWVRFVPSIRDAVAGIKRLHEEYGYVLADIRNMFMLTVVLLVMLVVLAQVI